MDQGSVFQLDPAAAHWLAETFDDASPEHALLDSLALSAEADAGRKGLRRIGDQPGPRPLRDLLSEETVGEIVEDVASSLSGPADSSRTGARAAAGDRLAGRPGLAPARPELEPAGPTRRSRTSPPRSFVGPLGPPRHHRTGSDRPWAKRIGSGPPFRRCQHQDPNPRPVAPIALLHGARAGRTRSRLVCDQCRTNNAASCLGYSPTQAPPSVVLAVVTSRREGTEVLRSGA